MDPFSRSSTLEWSDNQDLIFQALSWYAQDVVFVDDDGNESPEYVIKVFGSTIDGKTVSASILDFKPYFFLKVDDTWTEKEERMLKDCFSNLLPKAMEGSIVDVKLVRRKDFWGFTNNQSFKFIRLRFKTIECMKFLQQKLQGPLTIRRFGRDTKFHFKQYESNIEPFIRFIHNTNIEPTGWIRIPKNSYNSSTEILSTNCNIDVDVKCKSVSKFECDDAAPFLIASFDIECTSSSGEFPVPVKNYKTLATQLYDVYTTTINKLNSYKRANEIQQCILYALGIQNTCNYDIRKLQTKKSFDKKKVTKNIAIHINDLLTILTGNFTLTSGATPTRDKIIDALATSLNSEILELPELEGDPIIQIGTTFHYYGQRECCLKHIITLGECESIDNCTVESCTTEAQLLTKWRDLILSTNPDILTGYNIFGFDFEYMEKRSIELGINKEFHKLSRFLNWESTFKINKLSSSALGDNILKFIDIEGRVSIDLMKVVQRDHKLDSYKLDNVAFHFTGMNKNDISPNDIFRLQKGTATDRKVIAEYCIQDCSLCNHLIMKLEIIANNTGMSNVCLVPLSYIFMRGQGIKIFSLVLKQCKEDGYVMPVLARNMNVPTKFVEQIHRNGQVKTVTVSKVEEQIKKLVRATDNTIIDEWIEKQLANKQKIVVDDKKRVVWINDHRQIVQSVFCKLAYENLDIPLDYNVCLQHLNYKASERMDDVVSLENVIRDCESSANEVVDDDSYEGAIVLDPKEGIYINDPVSVLDYASLYPSSMISENLSHDCIVLDPKYDNLPGVEYLDISYDIYSGVGDKKTKVGERVCRFVQPPNGEKGIIPRILMKLLKARKTTRKKMEMNLVTLTNGESYKGFYDEKNMSITTLDGKTVHLEREQISSVNDLFNDFHKAVLDGLQLAYKVTANSLYGQIGAKTSPIYLKDIAACTTATGRKMIMMAKEFLEENYNANVVYGDTDSLFIIFPNDSNCTGKEKIMPSICTAIKASGEFKKTIKPPHDLEYEKTFYPFILLSKKRYVGNLYETDDKKFKQKSMGIVLKRRDNANIVKKIYGGLIDIILNQQDIPASVAFLRSHLNDMVNGKCPLEDLIITKSLKSDYKDPTRIAHKVLAERIGERDPGNKPQVNDRIPFVYIQVKEKKGQKILQGERIEHPDYIRKNKLKPDYEFYITNQIMQPILQLYAIIIEQLPNFNKTKYNYTIIEKKYKKEYEGNLKRIKEKMGMVKESHVKEMLFDPYLIKLNNVKQGNQDILMMFQKWGSTPPQAKA